MPANSNFAALAAAGFIVGVGRFDVLGTAATVTAGNIVEYDCTPD